MVFLDAGNGNILAFLNCPIRPRWAGYSNTPEWVQHISFRVKDEATLSEANSRAEAAGLDVLGPTDHGVFKSIYFLTERQPLGIDGRDCDAGTDAAIEERGASDAG